MRFSCSMNNKDTCTKEFPKIQLDNLDDMLKMRIETLNFAERRRIDYLSLSSLQSSIIFPSRAFKSLQIPAFLH